MRGGALMPAARGAPGRSARARWACSRRLRPARRGALGIDDREALGPRRAEEALVGGDEGDVFARLLPEVEGGSQMDRVESAPGMPLDQIAGEHQGPVAQVNTDQRLPVELERPADQAIVGRGQSAFTRLPGEGRVDLR